MLIELFYHKYQIGRVDQIHEYLPELNLILKSDLWVVKIHVY